MFRGRSNFKEEFVSILTARHSTNIPRSAVTVVDVSRNDSKYRVVWKLLESKQIELARSIALQELTFFTELRQRRTGFVEENSKFRNFCVFARGLPSRRLTVREDFVVI